METWGGRIKCKMHDLVHDLSRSILGDEISLAVSEKATNCTKICRYFSIMEHTRHLPPKNTFQKARAMYIAENDDFIFGKASKNAKHLCSISVKDVHTSALRAILETKNLRYLNILGLKYETLPEVISDIWSLQALHVISSDLVMLPESIGKLQKLRVINLSYSLRLTGLLDSIGNCVMISRIHLFRCHNVAALPSSIGRNKRLRVLRLGNTKLERLPSSITALENLECLDLQCCFELEELPKGIGKLKKLVVLNLQGCEKLLAIPKGIGQLTRLETLGLFVMGEDAVNYSQIPELENVNKISGELTIRGIARCMEPDVAHKECLKQKTNLQSLRLIYASNVGVNSENKLEGLEPPPGIKILKIVRYSEWIKGLTALQTLEISSCPDLERRCERRKGKDWHLTSHIPHLLIGQSDARHHFIWYTRRICIDSFDRGGPMKSSGHHYAAIKQWVKKHMKNLRLCDGSNCDVFDEGGAEPMIGVGGGQGSRAGTGGGVLML
ncbi:unnamed protein product [Miscanthus lutarioriparius]|uniref:Disease resistance R13L4/SHOC-2-like LRR domain-containing protein n=1 Tax=Miscanthus lutarioriparius TaxID=422564 RepID=A0A811QQG8_9POAL|nr:unnamed protein product [Miscanthus lutarioriparius]